MSSRIPSPARGDAPARALFDRVLAVVDETPESLVDAPEARRLCCPTGHLELVAFAETPYAMHAGAWAPAVALLAEGGRSGCALLAVAGDGRRRLPALVLRTTDAVALHEAPCSGPLAALGIAVAPMLAILDGRRRDGTATRRG